MLIIFSSLTCLYTVCILHVVRMCSTVKRHLQWSQATTRARLYRQGYGLPSCHCDTSQSKRHSIIDTTSAGFKVSATAALLNNWTRSDRKHRLETTLPGDNLSPLPKISPRGTSDSRVKVSLKGQEYGLLSVLR